MIEKVLGIVKWFSDEKGYGFIIYNEVDYFVHYKSILMKGHKVLEKGQAVRFVPVATGEGKFVAKDVEVILGA